MKIVLNRIHLLFFNQVHRDLSIMWY